MIPSAFKNIEFIRSKRVLTSSKQEPAPAVIKITGGKISAILPYEAVSMTSGLDLGNLLVMPGIVDTHVHMNEPGRTEWEGMKTASQAAVAGGITTLMDMPLNSIPATTSVAALLAKKESADTHRKAGALFTNLGFWGGVVPGNSSELEPMILSGARGFKCFLIESGVDEFKFVQEHDLKIAMPILARHGVPLLVHAEIESPVECNNVDPRDYAHYLESRPQQWEVQAIQLMIRLSEETGCAVHIVHLSSGEAVKSIRAAEERGVRITAETCPHYLCLSSEAVGKGATQYKCAPPIREFANNEKLWLGLKSGAIDFIVSDHSPCTPALKKMESGDFDQAWGGIAGLQFGLSLIWTQLRIRKHPLSNMVQWMCEGPAKLLGLEGIKGTIAVGADADFVIWDPDQHFQVTSEGILHRHKVTPYLGLNLYGTVQKTIVGGQIIFDRSEPQSFVDASYGSFVGDVP